MICEERDDFQIEGQTFSAKRGDSARSYGDMEGERAIKSWSLQKTKTRLRITLLWYHMTQTRLTRKLIYDWRKTKRTLGIKEDLII